jgi:hypothetical protein
MIITKTSRLLGRTQYHVFMYMSVCVYMYTRNHVFILQLFLQNNLCNIEIYMI